MNCTDATQRIEERPLGLLDDAEAQALDAHLADCADCRAVAEALDAIHAELAEPQGDPVSLSPNLRSRVVDAMDAEHALAAKSKGLVVAEAPDPQRVAATGAKISLACSYCHDRTQRAELVFCAACLAPHHEECFAEHGRCCMLGCEERSTVRPTAGVEPRPRAHRRRWHGRGLIVFALAVGLPVAAFGVYRLTRLLTTPPALTVTEYENGAPVALGVGEAKVIEVPYSPSNPPEGFDTRPIDFTGGYQRFYEDETVQVEWLNYPNRVVLLLHGLEEGPSTFRLLFPASHTALVFQIEVEGSAPRELAHQERQAELATLAPRELRKHMAQSLDRGDGFLEGHGPGEEHFLWLALQEYEGALDAGNALRDHQAAEGAVLEQADRERIADANMKLEETREAYARQRDELERRYEQTFTQRLPAKRKLAALLALMRGIGHEDDVQFKRLRFALEDSQRGFGKRWEGF